MAKVKTISIEASISVSVEFQTARFSMGKTIEMEEGDDETQVTETTAAELRSTCQQWAEFVAEDLAKRNSDQRNGRGRR